MILIVFSCFTNKDEKLKKQLIGEWRYSIEIPSNLPQEQLFPPNGFIFYENGDCEYKRCFVKVDGGKRLVMGYGPETKYAISNDTLKIFDPSDSTWIGHKIYSIRNDTLILEIDSTYNVYVRHSYKLIKEETYDKIIVSSSGCYGSCPIMDICINSNGSVIYDGQAYNTINGLFTSNIKQNEYLNIETNFKKAGIPNLEEKYIAGWTDDEEVSITFIKNSRIYKTIRDYGRQSPWELYWAYMPVRYLYQHLKLIPFKNAVPDLPDYAYFHTAHQICELSKSESFYLKTEFYKSKEVNIPFDAKYTLTYWKDLDQAEIIYSDGRYFKFSNKNQWRTFDLGYNFLMKNNLMGRFREK
jgi:hypothetical protein